MLVCTNLEVNMYFFIPVESFYPIDRIHSPPISRINIYLYCKLHPPPTYGLKDRCTVMMVEHIQAKL